MKKVVGYVLAVAGLVVLAAGIGAINLKLEILKTINSTYIMIAGVILILAGAIVTRKLGGKKKKKLRKEVPIFEGEDVVGYRRQQN